MRLIMYSNSRLKDMAAAAAIGTILFTASARGEDPRFCELMWRAAGKPVEIKDRDVWCKAETAKQEAEEEVRARELEQTVLLGRRCVAVEYMPAVRNCTFRLDSRTSFTLKRIGSGNEAVYFNEGSRGGRYEVSLWLGSGCVLVFDSVTKAGVSVSPVTGQVYLDSRDCAAAGRG